MVIVVHDREDTKLSKDTNNRAGVTITEIPDGFLQTPQNSRTFWRFGVLAVIRNFTMTTFIMTIADDI